MCLYKRSQISQEAYKKVKLKLLRERYFWINRKDLEVESD